MEDILTPHNFTFNLILIFLIGGFSIFFLGLDIMTEALKVFAGEKLKVLISSLSKNRFLGLAIGAFVTLIVQSSTATTAMLISFANSSLVSLRQAISILLGADIGTTIVVQLISFKISKYSLLAIAIGFGLSKLKTRSPMKYFGQALLGVGLIFFGLNILTIGTYPLKSMTTFKIILNFLGGNFLLSLLIGAIITALIHSSAATIGLVMSLAMSGNIDIQKSIPFILGANIGTCVTGLLVSLNSKAIGKQIAISNFVYKIIGVLIIIPFLDKITLLIKFLPGDTSHSVANVHTLFNIMVAFVFLPILPLTEWAIKKIIYDKPELTEPPFSTKYLDYKSVDTPALAFGEATREILRMSDIVKEMLSKIILVFQKNDPLLIEYLEELDDKVDYLDTEIKLYLTKISQNILSAKLAKREVVLITLTSDLETIGDIVNKNLLELAKKKINNNVIIQKLYKNLKFKIVLPQLKKNY